MFLAPSCVPDTPSFLKPWLLLASVPSPQTACPLTTLVFFFYNHPLIFHLILTLLKAWSYAPSSSYPLFSPKLTASKSTASDLCKVSYQCMSPALTSPLCCRTVPLPAHRTSLHAPLGGSSDSAQHQTHEPSLTSFHDLLSREGLHHHPATQPDTWELPFTCFSFLHLLSNPPPSPMGFTSQIALKTTHLSPYPPQPP